MLKETKNSIFVEGVINSKNFRFDKKKVKDQNGKEVEKEYIGGTIEVKTSVDNIVPIDFFSYKQKKDGEENQVYKGLQTIYNETKSLADVENQNEATKVRVSGQFNVNEFIGKDGNFASSVKYKTNFFNRINDDSFQPQSKFEVEIIVRNFREEIKDDESTGAGFLDGWIVDYRGQLKPVSFKIPENLFENMSNNIQKDNVVIVWGEIKNSVWTEKIVNEASFGDSQEKIITKSQKERLINGGTYSDYELDLEEFKKALIQRQKFVEAEESKEKVQSNNFGEKRQEFVFEEQRRQYNDEEDLPFNFS